MSVSSNLRREVERFATQFGLRWGLDNADLPPGTNAARYSGTHDFSRSYKDDTTFNSNAAKRQKQLFLVVWAFPAWLSRVAHAVGRCSIPHHDGLDPYHVLFGT